MPSTYDPLLRLELQGVGENATTWGVKTNSNIELIAAAVAGSANINLAGSGDYTLSTANAPTTDEARCAILILTGTLTGNRNVIMPTAPKNYIFVRNTSGAFNITVKQAAGTGTVLPASGPAFIINTSTTSIDLMAGLLDNYGIRITETT